MGNSTTSFRRISVGLALAALAGQAMATLYDRGGGLIYDSALNITWLQDANYAFGSTYDSMDGVTDGKLSWVNAVAWAANLTYHDSVRGVTYDDWRLPTVGPVNGTSLNFGKGSYDGSTDYGHNISAPGSAFPGSKASEMAYLYYNGLGNVSRQGLPADSCMPSPPSGPVNTGPFSNFNPNMSGVYWSGGAAVPQAQGSALQAVLFSFGSDCRTPYPRIGIFDNDVGGQFTSNADNPAHALAVRSGDVAPVPEAKSFAMMLAGLCALAAAVWRRRKT